MFSVCAIQTCRVGKVPIHAAKIRPFDRLTKFEAKKGQKRGEKGKNGAHFSLFCAVFGCHNNQNRAFSMVKWLIFASIVLLAHFFCIPLQPINNNLPKANE